MVSRRAIISIIAVLGVLLGGDMLAHPAWAQSASERVVVTPGDGTLQTRFHFTGTGFVPGRTVSVIIMTPDGVEHRFLADDGAEVVWMVQSDGSFALELIPGQRFPGTGPGRWRALFCSFAAPTCQLVDFDVTP